MDINRITYNGSFSPLMNILNIINSPIIISNSNILDVSFQEQEIQKHPTEKNFINSLEVVEFKEDQKEIYCGICLNNFRNGDKAYILPCKDQKHYFHVGENTEDCCGILPWLEENNTCPICRESFPKEKDIDEIEEHNANNLNEDIPVPNENFDSIEGENNQDENLKRKRKKLDNNLWKKKIKINEERIYLDYICKLFIINGYI